MPSRDNHVMMTLKLDRWAQDHTLRAFEIEREIMAARRPCAPKKRAKRFSLGNLKLFWTSTA
ncbi:hypothetical protein RUE5091_03418 [Ruegeria denitrificans]|uniref:Uncharacterized protein n=1 Tax=Ruegeria denitrificans TaxID=1715692 RepID=A0A0P1IPN1_9RHOB|nr:MULTISPECIES: hypothetical protein [Ruegeria]CUK11454.1 hypothetical protein RUE5091_03418 [Ruegeria denitrificans]